MANILVVDDEADLRQLVKTALERDGHRVAVLASGGEVDENRCAWADCILLDVMMPGEDGFATCARVGSWQTARSCSSPQKWGRRTWCAAWPWGATIIC